MNSQFGCFGPERGVGAGGCLASLLATVGKRCGRSKWIGAWRGCGDYYRDGARSAPTSVCKVSAANEHTRTPQAIGRAEQRSGDRIRAGACLSVASLRPTPGGASSARHPAGARPLARLSFAYLFFGEAKKSKAGGRPNLRTKTPSLCLLSFGEAKESNSAYKPKPDLKTMHCKYCTYGSPRRCAPRDDQALQAFLLITFLWPSKEK